MNILDFTFVDSGYRIGRKNYLVSEFVERGDTAYLTVPFIVSSGIDFGALALIRQCIRHNLGDISVGISVDNQSYATIRTPSSNVSRFNIVKNPLKDLTAGHCRLAKFYDFRVGIGGINCISSINLEFECKQQIIKCSGNITQMQYPHVLNPEIQNDDVLSGHSQDKTFNVDVYSSNKQSFSWQALFPGYKCYSLEWTEDVRKTRTSHRSIDRSFEATLCKP